MAHSPRISIRWSQNFLCPYLRACAFGIWWGTSFENEGIGVKNPTEITLSTPACTAETWFNATFLGPILRKYTSDDPQTLCAHTWGNVHSNNGGGPLRKCRGWGKKIHVKSPLAPQLVPLKLDSMPPSKGPFSASIHPIIPKLSVPIPEGMCIRKIVGGSLRKCRDWGQKSTLFHL